MSDSLWPHGLQHSRLPCQSPSPGACSNSRPLSRWCHAIVSSSVTFFSCLQPFPASGSFPVNWLFESGGQSIGASASVLPMNIQCWFPLGYWLVWSLWRPRKSKESSSTKQFRNIYSSALSFFYGPTLISVHDYWKNHSFDYMNLCWQSTVSFLTCCLGLL